MTMKSLVVVALLMPGCRDSVEEQEGSRSASLTGVETPVVRRASEIPLVALASVVPTFGGYFCESGDLIVLDTNPTGAVAAHIPDVTLESCREWRARPEANQPPIPNIIERQAQYTFLRVFALSGDGRGGVMDGVVIAADATQPAAPSRASSLRSAPAAPLDRASARG